MKTTIESRTPHCGGNPASFPMRSVLACAALLATTALGSADVTLKGRVGSRIINDDVVIARGTTCVLEGTTIKGDVRVLSGAKLYANGAWVDGSVFAYRSELVAIQKSSRVTWNVRGNRTRILVRGKSHVGGHMRLTRASVPDDVDALLVRSSTVIGNVVAKENKGKLRILNSQIEGKLRFVENGLGKYVIRYNEVWKNLHFLSNNGKGFITDNTVGGDLESKMNTPIPAVKRNTVQGEVIIME
jgi:hypothetical protein